jgi:mannose-6-phosphate isomerase-like protein (cupin superfamily)
MTDPLAPIVLGPDEGRAYAMLVGDRWIDAPRGSFVFIPAGTTHDFANRSDAPMGLFNVFVPGGFETNMPAVVRWFEEQAETNG